MSHHQSLTDSPSMIPHTWFHRLPQHTPASFRAFRQFNHKDMQWLKEHRGRALYHDKTLFDSNKMPDKIAKILCGNRLINVKELVESFEFFQRVRHRLTHTHVADLCCGHGLVGMLFALLERTVEHVYLLDIKFPPSSLSILEALHHEFPWVKSKIHYIQRSVKDAWKDLPHHCSCVAVHACGAKTDWALDTVVKLQSDFAVMPCCYTPQVYKGPKALKDHLGTVLSVDIQRTYELEKHGYKVNWQEIPESITPMNRILSASFSSNS